MEFFKFSSMISMFCSLGRLERLIFFLSMTLFLIFEDYINYYIYMFLLGETLALNDLHFDNVETETIK